MRYGYIDENGVLQSKELTEKTETYPDKKGGMVQKVITIEDQIKTLSDQGWKPIDDFDSYQCVCEEDYTCNASPYDAGDRISYKYEKVINTQRISRKIEKLQKEVAETDYQVRKCMEYSLVGKQLPYDIQAIHAEAEAIRAKIRELEKLL